MGAQKRQYLVELGIEHSIGHTLVLLANLISRHDSKVNNQRFLVDDGVVKKRGQSSVLLKVWLDHCTDGVWEKGEGLR